MEIFLKKLVGIRKKSSDVNVWGEKMGLNCNNKNIQIIRHYLINVWLCVLSPFVAVFE